MRQNDVRDTRIGLTRDQIADLLFRATLEVTGHGAGLELIRGARILLVEDNAINQQVVAGLLEQMGMRVEIAGNGREGVAKVMAAAFDLVLMDVQMPEMDGFEATRTIRKMPGFERLPIVAMTAHAMVGDREKSLQAGMFDHLTKPIEVERLVETLLRWVRPHPPVPLATPRPVEAGAGVPVVAGLDTRMGQQLVGGSLSLYLKLLKQFQVEHGPEAERVRAALGEDRPKDAERMAHSVKGAAAVLGANALSAASAALEIALRDNAPEMATRFELFARELDAVCGPLRAHFER